ncbi:MAG: SagB/ThcOx family dehydrogenase [Armatimonadota bacterium]|nr:SagB/ThcOx family dehydrogenase [Armatimonadota bacterium]
MRRAFMLAIAALMLGVMMVACPGQEEQPERIDLPEPDTSGDMSVEEAIAQRRSVRQFADRDLSAEQVGQLAWAAQGITDPRQGFRASPSAGATYPMELYLVTPDGVHHYLPREHAVETRKREDVRADLAAAALGQDFVGTAPLDIVVAAVYQRTMQRYGDRGRRYVHMEAGHIGQNIHLQAEAMGLASVPVGAFDDAGVARTLGLPTDQEPLYIIPVGYPR